MATVKQILIKIGQGLYEYLLFFPIFIAIGVYLFERDDMIIWFVTVPILFVIGLIYRSIVDNKPWWNYTIFSLFVGLIPTFVFVDTPLLSVLFIIGHGAIVFRGMMYVGKIWRDVLPISYMWVGGFVTYFIGTLLFPGNDRLADYFPFITYGGAAIIVLTLFISNRTHIKSATLSKEDNPFVSKQIRIHNVLFIILTIGIIGFITYGKVIQDLVLSVVRGFVQFLLRTDQDNPDDVELVNPPDLDDLFEDIPEPSLLAQIIDIIIATIGYTLMFIGAIILIMLLIRKSREWILEGIERIIKFIQRLTKRVREDDQVMYIEEKENIFNWDDWLQERKQQLKNFVGRQFTRKPRWDTLTNEEKVRFVYRQLVQQAFEQDINLTETPRETIEKIISSALVDQAKGHKLRDAYERVRYGQQEVDHEIIMEIYTLIQRQ